MGVSDDIFTKPFHVQPEQKPRHTHTHTHEPHTTAPISQSITLFSCSHLLIVSRCFARGRFLFGMQHELKAPGTTCGDALSMWCTRTAPLWFRFRKNTNFACGQWKAWTGRYRWDKQTLLSLETNRFRATEWVKMVFKRCIRVPGTSWRQMFHFHVHSPTIGSFAGFRILARYPHRVYFFSENWRLGKKRRFLGGAVRRLEKAAPCIPVVKSIWGVSARRGQYSSFQWSGCVRPFPSMQSQHWDHWGSSTGLYNLRNNRPIANSTKELKSPSWYNSSTCPRFSPALPRTSIWQPRRLHILLSTKC